MKKIFALVLSALLCFCFLAGCGDKGGTSSVLTQSEQGIVSPENTNKEYARDALTGEYTLSLDAKNKRPVAIMINNIKVSLPQRGISQASIIYEALAEGGITRLMAVFPDVNKIPDVGSVRSARHYYLSFANAHDATFVHFGGSKYVLDYIKNNGVKTINFLSSQGSYRDKNRVGKIPYEHTAFTSGDRLVKALKSKNISLDGKINDAYKFGDNSKLMVSGSGATDITVPFSSYTKATFTYNKESGKYEKGQFGAAHIDESTGKALEFTNVFILQTEISLMNANSKANYIDVKLNSGSGYYACGGKIIPISWSKGGINNEFKYYTTDGKELTVKEGKSYVGVVKNSTDISYSAPQSNLSSTEAK